jgi:hypothetical protein
VLAVLLAGCQFRLGTDIAIGPDGAGTLEVSIGLDAQLRALLTDAGMDPREGLEEAAAAAGEVWRVDVDELSEDGGEGLLVRMRASFDDPAELEDHLRAITSQMDEDIDGQVLDRFRVGVDDSGVVTVDGVAGLVLPTVVGARGDGVAFDGDDLARLIEERGDELVRYDLRVTLPAPPVEHDADEVDGATLTWHLPVGETRSIAAVSDVPRPGTLRTVAIVFVIAAAAGAAIVAIGRRRSPQRAGR